MLCLQTLLTVTARLVLQELRKGKFIRVNSAHRDVLHTIAELQLPVESTASTSGVTLLPSPTVEQLLLDKRRLELVQPFKLALLKLASQVCAWDCMLLSCKAKTSICMGQQRHGTLHPKFY